jgi:hypothetical protein
MMHVCCKFYLTDDTSHHTHWSKTFFTCILTLYNLMILARLVQTINVEMLDNTYICICRHRSMKRKSITPLINILLTNTINILLTNTINVLLTNTGPGFLSHHMLIIYKSWTSREVLLLLRLIEPGLLSCLSTGRAVDKEVERAKKTLISQWNVGIPFPCEMLNNSYQMICIKCDRNPGLLFDL